MVRLLHSQAELAALCTRYHVRELAVFGSAARGEAKPDSDIDVLVEFDPAAKIGFIELSQLSDQLEPFFGRQVDLAIKSGLKEVIKDEVLREAQVLFAA